MRAVMHLFARVQHGSRADVVHCDAWMLQLCECHDIYTRDMTHSNTSHDAPWQVHHFFGCKTSCEIFRLFFPSTIIFLLQMECVHHANVTSVKMLWLHRGSHANVMHHNGCITLWSVRMQKVHHTNFVLPFFSIFFPLFFFIFFFLLQMQCVHHTNVTTVNLLWVRHGSHANVLHHNGCITLWSLYHANVTTVRMSWHVHAWHAAFEHEPWRAITSASLLRMQKVDHANFFLPFFSFFFPPTADAMRASCKCYNCEHAMSTSWLACKHDAPSWMHHHECTTLWWMHQLLKFLVVAHMRMWCTMMSVL